MGADLCLGPAVLLFGSPFVAYWTGRCAHEVYKAYPDLPSKFKHAVAREFSQALIRSSFIEAMTARTRSPVVPLEGESGAGAFTHADVLTAGTQQGMDAVVELAQPVVALGGADPKGDNCDYANLSLSVNVRATRIKDRRVIYDESVVQSCVSHASFDTVGRWLDEPGALASDLAPCAGSLASKVLDYDSNPYTHRPQLKLPNGSKRADGFVAPDSGPIVSGTRPRYDLPAASTATESALPAYDATIAGKWVLVYDPSIRMPAANIDANGDVRTYRVALEPSLKWYLRHTIEPLFQEIQTEVEVPSASRMAQMGAIGVIVVQVDELSVRWDCVEGAYTASSTVTLSLDARFADGRPLAAATD